MSEEHTQESEHGSGVIWVVLVAAFPVLYVLSIGPAGALAKKNPNLNAAVRAVYYPVIWLHNYTPLKKPLEAYARLWGWD